MITGEEQTVGTDEVVTKFHGEREWRDDVEPDALQVFARGAGEVARPTLEDVHLVIEATDDEGQCPPEVRADEFQFGFLLLT